MPRFIAPAANVDAFTCPSCGTFAQMAHAGGAANFMARTSGGLSQRSHCETRRCPICDKFVIFMDGRMVYPRVGVAPPPHEDTPPGVLAVYEEAAAVSAVSPRAAIALLRLAIETLLEDLVGGPDTLHGKIGALVADGRVSERQQKALDTIRVTGNDAIHAGQIGDPEEDGQGCQAMFRLLNGLIDSAITRPREIDDLYDALPESKRRGVEDRDGAGGGGSAR